MPPRFPSRISRFARTGVFAATLPFVAQASLAADAPSAVATPAPQQAPAALAEGEFRERVEQLLSEPRFSSAEWGIKVASLETGRVIYERDAGRRLSPASNSKLYSCALALDQLGSDYRITTPVYTSAAVDSGGELRGDLIVAGRGDPSLNPRRSKTEFLAALGEFVTVVQRAGIKRIAGDIVGDATFLRCPPHGAGWTADDLNDYYGAEISALSLDENYVDVHVAPGAEVGAPCSLKVLQPFSGLVFENRTVTGRAGSARYVQVLRLPGENRVVVFGSLPIGGKVEETEATVPQPATWFAISLKEALRRAGIEITGRARSVRWPDESVVTAQATQIGDVKSPPLSELVSVILKVSQNLRTDLLFAHLGELRRKPDTPPWRTSDQLALRALNDFLCEHALRADDVIFDEGSGLSRNNLTTAAATVTLLQFMATHREREAFVEALPVAGLDGTLRRRMKGTSAQGNVLAKTGTLRWANSLSGYATSVNGERLVFSVMLNRNVAPLERASRDDIDEIAVLLTQLRTER